MSIVSIIVPCYDQAQYLDECLQSVLNQTYQNWECIIVNDGSPDNTEEVAEKWLKKDSRFKYLYKENGGVSTARNFGISQAEGKYILPLDADDKISSKYIDLAVEAFQNESTLKLVYCKAEKFGEEIGEWILKPFSLYNLAQDNMIFCSALYKKDDWSIVGGYDEKMISGLEDWEFWITMLKQGGSVKCLDIYGFEYRIKEVSRQKKINKNGKTHLFEYLSVKHADFFVRQLGSFMHLNHQSENLKISIEAKFKSKKFVIDLFCKTFFGFQVFKKISR